jgi:hypothetical protein
MNNYIKYIAILIIFIFVYGCNKEQEEPSKTSFQILADKERELNDREARIKLKEIELEERERKMGLNDNSSQKNDSQQTSENLNELENITAQQKDSLKKIEAQKKKITKKEIQKEITKRFENPTATVKDYYEYIQRGINESGNFDSNMKKAQKYFPSRSVDKLKSNYRNTKQFSVIEEPKLVTQKDSDATVVAKVKQTQIVKQDGTEKEVTKTLTVTYNLKANKNGEWVIVNNTVKND